MFSTTQLSKKNVQSGKKKAFDNTKVNITTNIIICIENDLREFGIKNLSNGEI